MTAASFVARQRRHHKDAETRHYAWKTRAPYFAETEARLLADVRVEPGERLLEIGCGEGGNLFHLERAGGRLFGVDYSPAKIDFARRSTGARLAVAEAGKLPFADASFDVILIRDVLHHLPLLEGALSEARRVLKRGGRFTLIEPNGRSPLVMLQATLVAAERAVLRSTEDRLRVALESAGFRVESARAAQPLPLARLFTHPSFGAPRLGASSAAARAFDALESLAGALLPRSLWMYFVFQAVKP